MPMDAHLSAIKEYYRYVTDDAKTLNDLIYKTIELFPGMNGNSISSFICKNVDSCTSEKVINSISFFESHNYITYTAKTGYTVTEKEW